MPVPGPPDKPCEDYFKCILVILGNLRKAEHLPNYEEQKS